MSAIFTALRATDQRNYGVCKGRLRGPTAEVRPPQLQARKNGPSLRGKLRPSPSECRGGPARLHQKQNLFQPARFWFQHRPVNKFPFHPYLTYVSHYGRPSV